MADVGQAQQPPLSDGEQAMARYKQAGFSQQEITQWQMERTSQLRQAGFKENEIDDYWGIKENSPDDVHAIQQQNPGPIHAATNPLEAFEAGWQNSDLGLSFAGKMPTTVTPDNAGLLSKIADGLGAEAGDLPFQIGGFIAGGTSGAGAGAAVPGAGETGASEVAGAGLGAWFGTGALPQAYREALIDSYTSGQRAQWWDFAKVVAAGTYRTMKAGVTTMVAGKAGEAAGNVAARVAKPWIAKGTEMATNAVAATTVSAGLEGRVPNADDFTAGVILAMGMHAAGKIGTGGRFVLSEAGRRVQNNLNQIYKQYGITPRQAIAMADKNPGMREEILAQDVHGDITAPNFAHAAPNDPGPKPARPGQEPQQTGATVRAYHGTNADFKGFDISQQGKYGAGDAKLATFFTEDPDVAASYAEFASKGTQDEGQNIRPVDLQMENPRIVDMEGQPYNMTRFRQIMLDAQAAGHDGVTFRNVHDNVGGERTSTVHAVFDPNKATKPGFGKPGGEVDPVEALLPRVRALEASGDRAISSAGAIGRYQIMPGTARQYGFDPTRLTDPAYNERAARTILADLNRRFPNDPDAVLAAYNGGPGRAGQLLKAGPGTKLEATEGPHGWRYERVAANRDEAHLPLETQEYLARGRAMEGADGLTRRVSNYTQRPWQGVADPQSVASYLQKFGDMAGFHFTVGPEQTIEGGENGPAFRRFANGQSDVYIPDTPEELSKRWYGLGKREIIFHEIGHALDFHVLHNDGRTATDTDLDMYPGLRDELRAASQEFAPQLWTKDAAYRAKPQELMADAIAKWFSDPTYRAKMPQFNKAFGELLQPYLDIANQALPEAYGFNGPGGGKAPPPPPPPGHNGGPPFEDDEGPKRIAGPTKEPDEELLRKLTPDTMLDRFNDNIGVPTEKHVPLRTGLEMELDAARRLDQNLINEGLLDPKKQLGIADMARQTYGSDGRWAHFLNKGPVDPITLRPIDGISMKDVAAEIEKQGFTKGHFNMYLTALRTIEKAAQGIDTGIFKGGLNEAKIIASNPKLQKLDGAVDMFQQFMNSGLTYARDSGVLSDAQVDKIKTNNMFYIPLRKLQGDESPLNTQQSPRWLGVRNPIRRMFGGEKEQIVDPWTAAADNMRAIIRASDRNRAAGAAYNALKQLGPQDSGLLKLEAPNVEVEDKGVFKKAFVEEGTAKAMNNFVAPKQYGSRNSNTFLYYDNGKPIVLEARDPDLARLYQGAETPAEATLISKIAQLPAKLSRAGIAVLDPTFGPRVILRHSQTAFIASDIHPFPIVNLLRGVFDAFGESDKYWEVMAAGGGGGSAVDLDQHVNDIRAAQKLFNDTGTAQKVWNTFSHPVEAMQYVTDRLAMANKIGAYKKATGSMGLEPAKAGMEVRKAFLDYREKFVSAALQGWSKYVPFFHADILGLRQAWDAVQPGKLPKTLAYATLGMILPQIALRAMNHWDDKNLPPERQYKNLPAWEKDMYYVTPEIDGQRIRIAKPYNFGPIVSAPLDAVIDKMLDDDPHAFDKSRLISDFMDAAPNIMPTAASAPIENLSNYSFFTGKPLIPDSVKERSPDLQYTAATSQPAIALAKLLGHHGGMNIADVSPADIDNLVQGWTGTFGRQALKALGAPFQTEHPPWQMADIPFVGSFFVRNPGQGAKPIEDFYSDYNQLLQSQHNATFEKKQQQFAGFQQDTMQARLATRMKGIHYALGVMRSALEHVNTNQVMSNAEKQQATDGIVRQMILAAQDGERSMQKVRK